MDTKDRLKDYRKSHKLSQTEFAASVGISQVALSQYELGTRPIPDVFIKSVCAVYGLSEDWLRTGEGDPEAKLSDDEELAEIFGTFLADSDPEKIRLAKSVLNLLDSIPAEYYPAIRDFCQALVDKHKN